MSVNADNGVFSCFRKSTPAAGQQNVALEAKGKDSSSRAVKVLAVLAVVTAAVALVALAVILIPAAAPVVAAVGGAVLAVTTLAVPSFVYPAFFGALSAILALSAFLVSRRTADAPAAAANSAPSNPTLEV